MKNKKVEKFSKMGKVEKIEWIQQGFLSNETNAFTTFSSYWHEDQNQQKLFDSFSENTISNFLLPYGIAPNFLIDGNIYAVPMVIEESSVVAAASSAAKYWMDKGGFKTTILGTTKVGHIHFMWPGSFSQLIDFEHDIKMALMSGVGSIIENMKKRGGGIQKVEFLDFNFCAKNLFQCRVHFQTCDSMGANFINTVLEKFATNIENYFINNQDLPDEQKDVEIIMSILSNYTPECLVRAEVKTPIQNLGTFANGITAQSLAEKFCLAIKIAHADVYRATTHNKGIFNGIDAVVLATGNDFRAVEAAGHAFAAKDGQYKGLSYCDLTDDMFHFYIDIPLAVGTIGGLTNLHPLAKKSLEILGNPSAETLMRIIASVGLAQNFSAVKSLVTTGIQQGHMKMHLLNILVSLDANEEAIHAAMVHFESHQISYSSVREFLHELKTSIKSQ
ncbi:MAG: hydroxymethylglutaryl-CoA reductase, degradative [Saprospiraceae bacterium]